MPFITLMQYNPRDYYNVEQPPRIGLDVYPLRVNIEHITAYIINAENLTTVYCNNNTFTVTNPPHLIDRMIENASVIFEVDEALSGDQ